MSEKYDLGLHVPQQVDNFLQAYASGDMGALERVKDNLVSVVDDVGFKKAVDDYNVERKNKFDSLVKNALESVETLVKSNKSIDLFSGIDEIRNVLQIDLNMMESEYWSTVREYVVGWMKKQ